MNRFLPLKEEARRVDSQQQKCLDIAKGIPAFSGDVAKIFHPENTDFCVSIPSKSLMPVDTTWEEKLSQMRIARMRIESDSSLPHLFVPRVLWKSESRSIAKIEWVEGTHLNTIDENYVFQGPGIIEKMNFVKEYLLYLEILHKSFSCIVDNKPSSLVATKTANKNWKLGLVDVSVQDKQELAKQFSETDPWKIEAMPKNDLGKTLVSIFGTLDPNRGKDFIYSFGTPHFIGEIGSTIESFRSAESVVSLIDLWLRDQPTNLDIKRSEIGDIMDKVKTIQTPNANFARSRDIVVGQLNDHYYGRRKSSDRQIAKSLGSLATMKFIVEKPTKSKI